jgi:hypothetical protein
MHSARWDWSYDLRGKKIGIIGNGESIWTDDKWDGARTMRVVANRVS